MAHRKMTIIAKFESTLVALRSRHTTLNERRAEAESALSQTRADQERFFLESDINDDGEIAKLENAVDAATLRLSSLSDACAALEVQIVEAERRIAAEVEREERESAAKDIAATADVIQERFESLLRDTRSLGEQLVAVGHLTFEGSQFGHFLRKVAGDIGIASEIAPRQLRNLAGAVEQGEAKVPRRPA